MGYNAWFKKVENTYKSRKFLQYRLLAMPTVIQEGGVGHWVLVVVNIQQRK
jgi:hypothetical protein